METSKAKHLAINPEMEEPRAIGKGMNCSQGIREGCMKGVTSSLGPEGEGEFHPADKEPHLGYCWWKRRKASSSRRGIDSTLPEGTYYSGKGPF